jgi:hypothetical protein
MLMRRVYDVSHKIDVHVMSVTELREAIAENPDQV